MDKGMKKVVNLVTNYMSALCETGRVPGRVDRSVPGARDCSLGSSFERARSAQVHETDPNVPKLYERLF